MSEVISGDLDMNWTEPHELLACVIHTYDHVIELCPHCFGHLAVIG